MFDLFEGGYFDWLTRRCYGGDSFLDEVKPNLPLAAFQLGRSIQVARKKLAHETCLNMAGAQE
jgi:hypothetical protein